MVRRTDLPSMINLISISDEGFDAGRLRSFAQFGRVIMKDSTIPMHLLTTTDVSGNPIYYTNQQDIFAGRDARLAGTIMLPAIYFFRESA